MVKNRYNLPEPIKVKYEGGVTKTGKLIASLLPAIFCDTSFLIDYWHSILYIPGLERSPNSHGDKIAILFNHYVKADTRAKKLYKIRERLEMLDTQCKLVFSPACRLEMEEATTQLRFKKLTMDVDEALNAHKKSNKEVGEVLRKIRKDFIQHKRGRRILSINQAFSELYWHFFDVTPPFSDDAFFGLHEVDVKNFSLTKRDLKRLMEFSNLQIGFADIFHLLTAYKLGCQYFFTFDNDFLRIEEEALKYYKIKIVSNPDTMLSLL